MLGPTGGSILASYLVLLGWRWTLRVLTILVGFNTLAIVLFMDETYASVLEKLHRERGDQEVTYMTRLMAMFRPNPQARDVVIRTFTVSILGTIILRLREEIEADAVLF